METDREAWLEAVTNDPLLPGRILPSDYRGISRGDFEIFKSVICHQAKRGANRQRRTFKPE